MIRIGMIGLGVIARFYAAALEKSRTAKLTAVCDINADRFQPYRTSRIQEFADYRALLQSNAVDAVIINAPNDQHFGIARAALLAGKHVCCEKPLTIRLEHALELALLAEDNARTLFTAFHRRYNRNLLLRLPELRGHSRIASVSADYLEMIQDHSGQDGWYLDPQRCGGGCIADNGPNAFDVLCAFLGPMDIVSARSIRKQGLDVRASLHLVSQHGIPVDLLLDWQYPHGEKKDLTVRFQDGRDIYINFLAGFSGFKESLWHEYEGVLKDFLFHIRSGQSDGWAGCAAVQLVKTAYSREAAA
jgi:L-arabinose 1-dehydrogenase